MSPIEQPIRLPGQPADSGPDYLRLPTQMNTYVEPELGAALGGLGRDWLERLVDVLTAQRVGSPSTRIELDALAPDALRELDRLLGRGEVRAGVLGQPELQFDESVFTGLWRLRAMHPVQGCVGDALEIGAVPDVLRAAARAAAGEPAPAARDGIPAEVGNAPHLYAELLHCSREFEHDRQPRLFNLDLLPLGPADQSWLVETLGSGPVVIVSEGYGATRIRSTRLAWTWWVQYYNSSDAMILNTLEIAEIPAVACAADDDLAESSARLRALLDMEHPA